MLSYRHSFHAGNFADVLKHIILLEMLQHMTAKEKGFAYVDTHGGAGLYNLQSAQADKLQEYQDGVAKLMDLDWPELALYREAIADVNKAGALKLYPGSPLFAAKWLRPQDHGWFHELHPDDFPRLQANLKPYRKCKVHNSDGLAGLLAVMPPASRRALVLIDPSYELKTEYDLVTKTLLAAHKKFSSGTYAIWYPVVERPRIERMQKQLVKAGIKDIQVFELGLAPDSPGRGMTASGMLVVNPPWQMMEKMQKLLPRLAKVLDKDGKAFARCVQLS